MTFPELNFYKKKKNEFFISGINKNKNIILNDDKINQLFINKLFNLEVKSAKFDLENIFSFKINNKFKIDNFKKLSLH